MPIRDATTADLDALVRIDPIAQVAPVRVRMIERLVNSATCLVAEVEDDVVGYVGLEYTFFELGFVPLLQVAEPHRRRGIGRALMEAIAERCTTPKLFTSTNKSNAPMRALLDSLGYVHSGVVDNLDPGDPEHFYVLERT